MALVARGLRKLVAVSAIRRTVPALWYTAKAGEAAIPTDTEQATGLEKKEIDALVAGVEDPFNMKVQTGPVGTKDKPRLVPSMYEERIVGCICEEDQSYINWMVLKSGSAERCECGHWFQLVQANPTKLSQ